MRLFSIALGRLLSLACLALGRSLLSGALNQGARSLTQHSPEPRFEVLGSWLSRVDEHGGSARVPHEEHQGALGFFCVAFLSSIVRLAAPRRREHEEPDDE